MIRPRVLLTGPSGRIGPQIVPLLREAFELRLFDARPAPPESPDEYHQGDIRDFDMLRQACNGMDAVVHLAAISDEDDFHSRLLPVNLAGAYNMFEAARQAGVGRVVFASTVQTVLNYGEDWVTPEMPVRPHTVYACTKVFGEALGRYYSDKHGMQVICLRIAWFQPEGSEELRARPELRAHWCRPRDLAQLIERSLKTPVRFGIYFAVSDNAGRRWDISSAQKDLGYAPEPQG